MGRAPCCKSYTVALFLFTYFALLVAPCRSEYGDNTSSSGHGEEEEAGEQELMPDLPASWVTKLVIPRDVYDMRCPRVCGSVLCLQTCLQ
jgi:hypothetical protein